MKVRKWNRILAFLLCICMLMGSVQIPVYASEIEKKDLENISETESEKKETENNILETESDSANEMTGTEEETEMIETEQETENQIPETNPETEEQTTEQNQGDTVQTEIETLPEAENGQEEAENIAENEVQEPEDEIELLAEMESTELETLASEAAFLSMYEKIFGQTYSKDTTKILYVAGTAPNESSSDVGTKENPYTSLQSAYDNATGNTVLYLEGAYTAGGVTYEGYGNDSSLQGGWLNGNKSILIAADAGISIPMHATWSFGANVGLYRVGISLQYANNTNKEIYCNGHTTIFGGEGMNHIAVTRTGTQYYPTLFGGSENSTVQNTNLTVNGGTFDRIYGGGSFGSVVTGTANLTVDGLVNGDANQCSVQIVKDDGLDTLYMDNKGESIVGGGATNKNENYGRVGNTFITISNLHQGGKNAYTVIPNGGAVTETAKITVNNSKLSNLWRGYGELQNIACQIINTDIVQCSLVQQYKGAGFGTGANVQVQAQGSSIKQFYGRQAAGHGGIEAGIDNIVQDFKFQNCTLTTLELGGNYNSQKAEDACELDNCTFLRSGYIVTPSLTSKVTLNFKNMPQEIVICETSEEAKKIAAASDNPGQVGIKIPFSPFMGMENTKVQLNLKNYSFQSLRIGEGSKVSCHDIAAKKISGTGILQLSDGSSAVFSSVESGTRIRMDVWGEIQDKVKVTAQGTLSGEEFFYDTGNLHLLKIPGKQISFWYLSPNEISYDQSHYVYVDQGFAGDVHSGTLEQPYSSLDEAYKALTPNRNQIVLMSSYILPVNQDLPQSESMENEEIIFSASDGLNDFSEFAKLLVDNKATGTYYTFSIQNHTTFQNIEIGGKLANTESGRIQLCANGYKLHMAKGSTGGITNGNTPHTSLYGGIDKTRQYDMVDIWVEDGYWATIGSGQITIGKNVPEGNVNLDIVTKIHVTGGSYGALTLYSTNYGSVELTVSNASSRTAWNYFGGVVYGNTEVSIKGNIEGSSYGDRFFGTYYGDVTYDTREAEKYNYYYALFVGGIYYKGADFFVGSNTNLANTGGIDIAGLYGTDLPLTAYEPVNITVEEGATVERIYASGAEEAVFHDKGCVNLYASSGKHITTAKGNESALNYKDQVYKKFHLYLNRKDKTVALENLYGFDTVTVEEGTNVSIGSPLHTKTLEIKPSAKMTVSGEVTVGAKGEDNGTFSLLAKSKLELLKPLYVYGTVQGTVADEMPGILALNNELYEETQAELYSKITGEVTGKIQLFTNQNWKDEKSQRLYVCSKKSADQFAGSSEEIHLMTEMVDTTWICKFGNKKDYSRIYLDGTAGNDLNDGLTANTAVKTLEQAYSLVTAKGAIIVSGATTVNSWEGTAKKPVVITSCQYAGEDKTDYRTVNQAVLKLTRSITLKEDTAFTCLKMDVANQQIINAGGHEITFGVEKTELPEGVENFSNTKYISVNGADANYLYPTSITIHSGTFMRVDPWTNDQRNRVGEENKIIMRVRMTGGTVQTMGVGTYVRPIGIAEYTLVGGKIGILGSQSITDYSARSFQEIYHLQDEVQCDAFYTSVSSYTLGKIVLDIKNLTHPLPLLCYGNKENNMISGPVEITVENAVIQNMHGGTSANAYSNNDGTVSIHLKQGAKLENFHCGSQGSVENLKKVSIYMEDSTASIDNLYANGISGKLRPEKVELYAVNGTQELPVNFLREPIDLLQIGQEGKNGCASIDKESAKNVKKLSVKSQNTAVIENGTVFGGDYQGGDTAENPAIWKTDNAASIEFSGNVSGYTEVTTGATNGFKNGFKIKAKGCTTSNPEKAVTTELAQDDERTVVYEATETNVVWSLADSEDNETRNTIYVSSKGDDSYAGAQGTPVKTLAQAYKLVAERKKAIESTDLPEEEKKKLIGELSICVLDYAEVGEMTQEMQEEIPEVTIKGEDPTKNPGIAFTDKYPTYKLEADTVLENITFYDRTGSKSPEIYAQGHEITVESTVSMDQKSRADTSVTLYGGSQEKDVTSTNLTVLGGSWKAIYGGGKNTSVTGDVNLTVGEQVSAGTVYGGGGSDEAIVNGNVNLTVIGGTYQNLYGGGESASVSGNVKVDYQYGIIESFYGGGLNTSASVNNIDVQVGTRRKVGEKAEIRELFRGSGLRAGVTDKVTVSVNENAHIQKNVQFCAGGYAGNVKNTELQINGGIIDTSVYGGGWGEINKTEYGNIQETTNVSVNGGTINGNVYAGGNNGIVSRGATLDIQNGIVTGNLYGGGNAAGVNSSQVNVNMTDGTSYAGNIFGGSYNITETAKDIQQTSNVSIVSANLNGNIFAGSDTAGTIAGSANITVSGNASVTGGIFGGGCQAPMTIIPSVTVSENATLTGNVYGGGQGVLKEQDGVLTSIKNGFRSIGNFLLDMVGSEKEFSMNGLQDANVPKTKVIISGTVNGNVYGGGELATTGTKTQTQRDKTKRTKSTDTSVTNVVINSNATVSGDIYGGGRGQADQSFATVFGNTNIDFHGTVKTKDAKRQTESMSGGNVFGGGESAPVEGTATVKIAEGTAENVYGGGNQAPAVSSNLTITGGTVTTAYGGGNQAEVVDAGITINGGSTTTAYAGGNAATVSKTATFTLNTLSNEKCVTTIYSGNNKAAMSIQPTMKLVSGQCDTFYGGGNQGAMTSANGLKYGAETFGSSDVSIGTVYGGCNNADVTHGVKLTLSQGTYKTVYGGNNAGGEAHTATVILDEHTGSDVATTEGKAKLLTIDEVYGGGNQANIQNTQVNVVNGTYPIIYGGGNQATVTGKVEIQLGENNSTDTGRTPSVTHLFGGNNNADIAIVPEFHLLSGSAENVYGGCNKGKMTKDSSVITFEGNANIKNLYGGCNEADVTGTLQLVLKDLPVENVYGGCNTNGHVPVAEVLVQGTGATNIFGGGRGNQTSVEQSQVKVQNGTVSGNVYGGSGYGYVKDANVTVKEKAVSLLSTEKPKIEVKGNVFGGGYGVSSVVENTHVTIDMELSIGTDDTVDLKVTEAPADTTASTADGEASSGETRTEVKWKNSTVSVIKGSVYGGGDMGKVGDGIIHQATNTATIETQGTTDVQVLGGNIEGSVFGGGSGTPAAGESYTIYMGTVFGTCNTLVQGGYVKGSIYGCGHQSRVYASDTEGKKQAAEVKVQEVDKKSVVIGTSIFGGGNKGEGANQNASVYTVVGDTGVIIDGLESNPGSTAIYFLSDSKGGVYGDGNLCLVKGNRTIDISDFNYGANNHDLLKTFYSLQRADQVTLTRTKIVLRGAKDLVDENADETVYAINRVGNLEMKESSTVKLTTIVKLLGGLSSDQSTDTVFIDRGNNGENKYYDRGGADPTSKLTEQNIQLYRQEYADYLDNRPDANSTYSSFNVICVANGDYLEVKKSDSEYGNVTGLFTLELLHANPGEGGGFVFANIGDKKASVAEGGMENCGSTGDFICVTKNSANGNDYMEVMDTVGGYIESDYTYYYWYIKGGKYTYNMNLQGYIGTSDTEFEAGARMPELRKNYHYILNKITGSELTVNTNSTNQFAKSRWKDTWTEAEMKDKDAYAIEVRMVPRGTGSQNIQSLGYLAYGIEGASDGKTEGWYIRKADGSSLKGTRDENSVEQEKLKANDVFAVTDGMTGLELQFILHKGSGVTVEIKNVPITMEFDVLKKNGENYDTSNGGDNAHVKIQTYTSITRIVPSQAIYLSGGRMYAGVSSDMQPSITGNSAFTAQVITKYVPSAFNSTGNIKEVLTASYDEIYLLDEENGIGFTVREADNGTKLIYATEGNKQDYEITKDTTGVYKVTYMAKDETGDSGQVSKGLKTISANQGSFIFPKGTKITLVAQMDDYTPTYWYYYVTEEDKKDIPLSGFQKMNTVSSDSNNQYSFEKASEGKISSSSSNRVTENLTFVFDFSEVEKSVAAEAKTILSGSILLRHQATIGSYTDVDIMDFVSKSTSTGTDENPVITYSRETPKISEPFKVSQNETGIEAFKIQPTSQEYYEKDKYEFQIDIQEDETWMNTQYEEREYAVVLELMKSTEDGSTEEVKKFPEGTTFWYQGNRISAGQENRSVIIPVKEEGKHLVTIQTELQGFAVGKNKIKASLYSSSVASYYNSISTSQKAEAVFHVKDKPETVLSVIGKEGTENTLLQRGSTLQLAVNSSGEVNTQQKVLVTVYQYQRENYKKMELNQIFETPTAELSSGDASWETKINSNAVPGTYRLEFQYGDKTEYWDFIIS